MTNAEIAHILTEIASLLDILGENTFKVRSYERAAETLDGLARPVEELVADGTLTDLPGIGKGLAEAITELVTTGESHYRAQLLEQAPEGLLEMLQIPGFGPKKAGLVFRERGIGSLGELEAAARAGALQGLKGFGAKTEEKILQGIALVRAGMERMRLGEALPLAEALVEMVRAHPQVLQAEMAGSSRRRRETVGDLDLLATSEQPAAVTAWFAAEGGLASVEVAGDTKVSGRTAAGLQVDLRVVPPQSYGAALQYFTGSMQHGVRLRERAQKLGLTLNEYGVFEGEADAKGPQVAGETEESVYAALGLPWIPPELREDRGEIAAAEVGRLPALLELADLRCDLHMHTDGSDGVLPLPEMAAAARACGYTHIAITDHSAALVIANGLSGARLQAQVEAIRRLNAELEGFTVLAGTEADILADGRLDVPDDVWPDLDFVIGSIHSGFSHDVDRMTGRIVDAMASGRMDLLAHPTGRIVLGRQGYEVHVEKMIAAAVEHAVALEINANPHRLDLSDVNARLTVESGAVLSINTDAHRAEELRLMRYGVMTARRGWVEAAQVINCWPLAQLQRWLAERRGR